MIATTQAREGRGDQSNTRSASFGDDNALGKVLRFGGDVKPRDFQLSE